MLGYEHTPLYSPVYLAVLLVVDLDELAEATGVVVVRRLRVAERLRGEPEIVTTGAYRQPTDKTAAIPCPLPPAPANTRQLVGITEQTQNNGVNTTLQ